MRQTISGLLAAIAVMAASVRPRWRAAHRCSAMSARARKATSPAPVYSGCYTGCGGWAYERLPDPVHSIMPRRCSIILLRRSGSDLYRSRRLRALSDLSGRHSVRLARLSAPDPFGLSSHHHGYGYSPRPITVTAIAPHYYGYPARAAPLLLIGTFDPGDLIKDIDARSHPASGRCFRFQPIRPSRLAPI